MRTAWVLILAIFGWTIAAPPLVRAQTGDDLKTRKSVVKITASLRPPDVFRPWSKTSHHEVTGSGVVIAGKRILTNAHLANYAAEVFIQPDKSSEKLPATVEAVAPGIDLAVLKLEDPSFFDAHPPLVFSAKLPREQQTVHTYGYPEGGTELSVTRGIISRIEYADYYLMTEGLRIQVDAAINPGNSGGPAVIDGEMIGLVFSKLIEADNIGYIIPIEEIELFLKDIKDGRYDGKPIFIDEIQTLENEALREKLRLDKKTTGVVVRNVVVRAGDYPLKPNDVITRIGDNAIDNLGMVRADGDRLVRFQYLIQRLAQDNKVPMTVVRDGQKLSVVVPGGPEHNRWLLPYLGSDSPSYFIYGPLVFTELTDDYVRSLTQPSGEDGSRVGAVMNGLYAGNPMFVRYGDRPAFPGERLVIIGHPPFVHKLSKGYHIQYAVTLGEINGVHIRNLKHAVEVIRDATGEFVEFTFQGRNAQSVVFKRKDVEDAMEGILSDNGIRQQFSADIAPIWNRAKTTK
jgi:S1-C subfamily serine protease